MSNAEHPKKGCGSIYKRRLARKCSNEELLKEIASWRYFLTMKSEFRVLRGEKAYSWLGVLKAECAKRNKNYKEFV